MKLLVFESIPKIWLVKLYLESALIASSSDEPKIQPNKAFSPDSTPYSAPTNGNVKLWRLAHKLNAASSI